MSRSGSALRPLARPKRPGMRLALERPTRGHELPLWWFNPRQDSRVREADPVFVRKLHEMSGGELAVTWHPLKSRWQVWAKSQNIKTWYCVGWKLLFTVENLDGSYRPLDERVLARCWAQSRAVNGDGAQYFRRIEAEFDRDKARADLARDDERNYLANEYWDYTKIKVAMRGASRGDKFMRHHA